MGSTRVLTDGRSAFDGVVRVFGFIVLYYVQQVRADVETPKMTQHLHLDFETYSEADIKKVGAYRYAFDPSTEILCAAMAFNDEKPYVWDCQPNSLFLSPVYNDILRDPAVLIYAHNAMFEAAICQALLQKTWGIPCPDLSRFRCTISLARRASLPSKMDTFSTMLNLKHKKDKRGSALIKKFSMMQSPKKPTKKNPEGIPARRIMPADEPEAFAEFVEYCRQDVRAEQELASLLSYFDEPINNANYSLDAVINARGVTVNVAALQHAQTLIDQETEIVSSAFRELTGFEVTQGAKFLEWLKGEGVELENLQAETIEEFLEGCV